MMVWAMGYGHGTECLWGLRYGRLLIAQSLAKQGDLKVRSTTSERSDLIAQSTAGACSYPTTPFLRLRRKKKRTPPIGEVQKLF